MGKIVRLTETELVRLVKRILKEDTTSKIVEIRDAKVVNNILSICRKMSYEEKGKFKVNGNNIVIISNDIPTPGQLKSFVTGGNEVVTIKKPISLPTYVSSGLWSIKSPDTIALSF
jgi:hypothetical protein